ncbi:cathepsin B-like [Anoplophora glabripennis]|uniref:cathepsin B-like n=1 Tax=Anoplophora glabripennis TaxID=217634 RepID=UPI000874659B|nr:cathepsin B-like [Anoplophora glabripennis]
MRTLFVITLVAAAFATAYSSALPHQIETEAFIKSINEKATTWTARKNFEGWTPEQLKSLAGTIGISRNPNASIPIVFHDVQADGIPDSFDSRQIWSFCESINTVRNQGACGGCWAFAAVEVMSDRLCIFSAGAKKFTFAPEELISCCTNCGSGCSGGFLLEPFDYWQYNGIPSGGDQGSNYGCRPYTAESNGQTPQCNKRCVSGYSKSWNDDIRHGIAHFQVTSTVEQIQHEIVINGPVSAYMEVFEDFYSYGSGIYQHTSGNSVGGHAVKIVGWGSENNVPYWIVANSWGTGFGEGGFFRIIRGNNNVGIESYVVAGNPNTSE